MRRIHKLIFYATLCTILLLIILIKLENTLIRNSTYIPAITPQTEITIIPSPSPTPIPITKILDNDYHTFQTFNNCGPASLSMALSFYGINVDQKVLGDSLRPYQIPNGDNDDKSVTLSELSQKASEYGLTPYHRPNGNIGIIKKFIATGVPVLVRTWTKPNEDIGHFRVIKGYDDLTNEIIQDDSLQGKNLRYLYDEFDILWEKFNYEYLVLISPGNEEVAKNILGPNINENYAWKSAVDLSTKKLQINPNDIHSRFNLSVALYKTGDFQRSIEEFETVEYLLPFRTLWYQIEPILAYYELKNFRKVIEINNKILSNGNRAFSELYLINGNIYKQEGQIDLAKREYEKAVLYNKNQSKNLEALTSI